MKNAHLWAAVALSVCLGFADPAFAVTQQEADAMLAAQNWNGAENAYEELLRDDASNAGNWFSLGQARFRLGDLSGGRRAYLRALENNHPTPGRVRVQLARLLMTMGRRDDALREIQQLVGTAVSHRTLLSTPEFAPLANAPEFIAVVASQTPCATPQYRQFDFWLGEWDIIVAPSTALSGFNNSITAQQDGCVVMEQYTAGAFTGMSINFYDSARQVWHQTWMSNQGGMLYLEGGINADGAMEMSDRGLPGATPGTINRTVWTPLQEGGLRQHWEVSSDNGVTWNTVFDGRYVRRAPR
ncbi:hypothetical protein U91I_01350 [alpha proteobacterium U9-1i]|nr:hypothetical protein U91I_01350 [alpha proteobacterium U9-1i]